MTKPARSLLIGVVLAVLVVVALLTGRGLGDPGTSSASPGSRGVAKSSARPTGAATRSSGPATRTAVDPASGLPLVDLDTLPRQVGDTVRLIDRGGPYPHRQDGVVFGNRERVLPRQASGFYHEYTVETPGSDDRGARRVVTGDDDRQFFYTGDHYVSFVRIRR